MRAALVASACLTGILLAAAPARAAAPGVAPSAESASTPAKSAERRAGFVLGGAAGVGFAGASGYPNDPKLIGAPDAYSSSSLLVGVSSSYFIMGALTDYLNVGPMLTTATFENATWRSTGFGVGFRIEVFPLLRLVPALADTAVFTQLGIGSTELQAKGPYPSADGTQSFLGIGLHHELRLVRFLGGHFAAGPQIEYDAIRSLSAERHWLSVGLRIAWYGGTVQADGEP